MNRFIKKKILVSCLIPTYNGRLLLEENLPPLLREVKKSRFSFEIIIVDDGSTDGTKTWAQKTHPQIKILRLSQNQGFLSAVKRGLRLCKGSFVLFLNNDVLVKAGFLKPLILAFQKNENLLAVSSLQEDQKGIKGQPIGVFKKGLLRHFDYPSLKTTPPQKAVPIFYANLACSVFDRKKLEKLGGPNPVFSPGYWEDTDLSFQGWQKGWQVLLEPKSRVWHPSETTLPQKLPGLYKIIAVRNLFLFNWLNLRSPKLIFFHILWLPARVLLETIRGNLEWLIGLIWALSKLGEISILRKKREKPLISDLAVIEFFKQQYRVKG